MENAPLKSFFGFAVIVDLRNFSEMCHHLLIQNRLDNGPSRDLKKKIYAAIFKFLVGSLEALVQGNDRILFDYKHTGDGFLFITRHSSYHKINSIDSFLFLTDIYVGMRKFVRELNRQITNLLQTSRNQETVAANADLSFLQNRFDTAQKKSQHPYIHFSLGAHCGKLYYTTYRQKKIVLGNTINQAARLQGLANTFSDYNLFFSNQIINRLKIALGHSGWRREIPNVWFKNLASIAIRGLGPTVVQSLTESHLQQARTTLARAQKEKTR